MPRKPPPIVRMRHPGGKLNTRWLRDHGLSGNVHTVSHDALARSIEIPAEHANAAEWFKFLRKIKEA